MFLQRDPNFQQQSSGTDVTQPVTTYRLPSFGDYNSILSDLITTNDPKNAYMRQSYTYDPTAVKNRLAEYTTLNQDTFDQYKPLLQSPLTTVSAGSNQLVKKTDLEKALSSINTKYGTLSSGDYTSLQNSALKDFNPTATIGGLSYFDKAALQQKLDPYAGLSSTQASQYAPLMGDVKSIGTLGGNTLYDKAALQNQLNKYGTLSADDYNTLKDSVFSGLSPLTSIGGQSYFDKAALQQKLDPYATLSSTQASQYAPLMGDVKSKYTLGGMSLYDKTALQNQLGKYSQQTSDWESTYAPLLGGLNAVATIGGNKYYDTTALKNQLGKYNQLTSDWKTKLDDSLMAKMFSDKVLNVDGNAYISTADQEALKNPFNNVSFYGTNNLGGYTPSGFTMLELKSALGGEGGGDMTNAQQKARLINLGLTDTQATTLASRLGSLPSDASISKVLDALGLSSKLISDPTYTIGSSSYNLPYAGLDADDARGVYNMAKAGANIYDYLGTGYTKDASGNLTQSGYFLPSNIYKTYNAGNGEYYYTKQSLDPKTLRQNAVYSTQNGQGGWIFPTLQNLNTTLSASGYDPSGSLVYKKTADQGDGGGLIGGFLGDVINSVYDVVHPITSITQFFDPTGYSQTYEALNNVNLGAKSGNWAQVAQGGLGLYGAYSNTNPAASLGTAITGNNGALANAVGQAAIGTGISALSGQNLADAIKSGAVSGLSNYGGSTVGSGVNAAIGGDSGKILGGMLGGGAASLINAGLRGSDLSAALQKGLIAGGLKGLGSINSGTLGTNLTGNKDFRITPAQLLSGGLGNYLNAYMANNLRRRA